MKPAMLAAGAVVACIVVVGLLGYLVTRAPQLIEEEGEELTSDFTPPTGKMTGSGEHGP